MFFCVKKRVFFLLLLAHHHINRISSSALFRRVKRSARIQNRIVTVRGEFIWPPPLSAAFVRRRPAGRFAYVCLYNSIRVKRLAYRTVFFEYFFLAFLCARRVYCRFHQPFGRFDAMMISLLVIVVGHWTYYTYEHTRLQWNVIFSFEWRTPTEFIVRSVCCVCFFLYKRMNLKTHAIN